MADSKNENTALEALTEEVTAAETLLRPLFEDTPKPSPEVLARIKVRLRAETAQMASARKTHHLWPVWGSAVAAAILMVAGLSLYFRVPAQPDIRRPSALHNATPVPQASLDAFTASLPKAMSAEDPAVRELNTDLNTLESQTSNTSDSPTLPADPSADRTGSPTASRSLARSNA